MQGKDIVQQLRDRAFSFKVPDPLMEAAADEIARLRLTDEERTAIGRLIGIIGPCAYAATLRGLLERLRGER